MSASEPIDKDAAQRFAQELAIELGERDKQANNGRATSASNPLSRWMARRRQRPGYVPMIQRTWVPFFCVAAVVYIWLPDRVKVRWLLWADDQHDRVRLWVHKQYWRATMDPDRYAQLMEQLEANVAPSERVASTKCPL